MFIESHLVMYEIEENGFFRLLHVNFQYQKKHSAGKIVVVKHIKY